MKTINKIQNSIFAHKKTQQNKIIIFTEMRMEINSLSGKREILSFHLVNVIKNSRNLHEDNKFRWCSINSVMERKSVRLDGA